MMFKIFVASTLIASVALMIQSAHTFAAAKTGEAAPSFLLKDADGKEHSLEQYKGKTVVLEWTNPDCPFVQRHYEKGTMKSLAEKYSKQGVVWLAVNSTHYNKPEDSKNWKEKKGLPYVTLQDAEGTIGRNYGAQTSPHMFIIDKEGKLVYAGAIDDDPRGQKEKPLNYVAQALDELLAGKPVSVAETKSYGCSVKYRKSES